MTKISVIVKSPEATGHLDDFMDALYAQTLQDWECHIIDGTAPLHSQKHCNAKNVFCQVMYEEFEEQYQAMAEMIARDLKSLYGDNHPVIITDDTAKWDTDLLEYVVDEELKNGTE